MFRNPRGEVQRLLEERHAGRYFVYNFCDEPRRRYTSFPSRIVGFGMQVVTVCACAATQRARSTVACSASPSRTTTCPRSSKRKLFFAVRLAGDTHSDIPVFMVAVLRSVSMRPRGWPETTSASWRCTARCARTSDVSRVNALIDAVLLDCVRQAGKGRAGMMACMLLVRLGFVGTADEAIECYNSVRVRDRLGLTVTSQKKWVRYYASLWSSTAVPQASPAIAEPTLMIDQLALRNTLTGAEPPELRLRVFQLDPATSRKVERQLNYNEWRSARPHSCALSRRSCSSRSATTSSRSRSRCAAVCRLSSTASDTATADRSSTSRSGSTHCWLQQVSDTKSRVCRTNPS